MSNYYSRIKDIFIQIHNYEFFHSPTDYIKNDNRLISREILTKRLKSFLDPKSRLFSGVYLITGFRGIGKTTLVRSALSDRLRKNVGLKKRRMIWEVSIIISIALIIAGAIKWDDSFINEDHELFKYLDKEFWEYIIIPISISWFTVTLLLFSIDFKGKKTDSIHRVIELNLSQDKLNEFDVLKSMVWSVYDEYKESLSGMRAVIHSIGILIFLSLSFIITIEFTEVIDIKEEADITDQLIYYLIKIGTFIGTLFIFYYLFTRMVYNLHRLKIITHTHILRRLSSLNDRINASVVEDERTSFKHFEFNLDFGGKSRNLDKVDAKEIEYELTQIFKKAEEVYFGFSPRRFVIVFDELDKVDFGKDFISKAQDEFDEDGITSSYYDLNPERRRREYIANLLGSLKHFFSSAKAKFIFIAGSEMFDASLADSTERDSFFGSIFHDIFYVPSFYTDEDHRTSDIKALTEKYLCRFLIPRGLHITDEEREKKARGEKLKKNKYDLSLKGYSEYLRSSQFLDDLMIDNNAIKESRGMLENDMGISYSSYQTIINKTVYTLYNFIIYLTSRSNGSPKKLTKLLEEHVVKDPDRKSELGDRPFFMISHKVTKSLKGAKEGLYLYFQELDQYKFGFNTYLFHPFYFTHSVYLTNHSDKLLVASSFLLSHFYKFHSLAFSRYSLEYTPEVVSYSKVPELRKFMEGLFDTISNKHIRQISSGLQTHRFRHRISSEIEFLSKILQQESAIYNFTLDESLPLKRFYTSKIKDFEKEYEKYNSGDNVRQPFAISHLNALLADLHFFDKDYEDALTYYHNALKYLAYVSHHTVNTFTHYLTNLLKIGLTYEKVKQYERAHGVYSRAHEELYKFVGFQKDLSTVHLDRTGHKRLFTYSITFLLFPSVARFALFEKGGSNGVTYQDYVNLKCQIDRVFDLDQEYRRENILIESEISHKIGNVLFFKNSAVLRHKEEGWSIGSIFNRLYKRNNKSGPVDALFVYYENLRKVLFNIGFLKEDAKSIKSVLKAAVKLSQQDFDSDSYRPTGRFARKLSNYISKLGDAFLCFDNSYYKYDARMVFDFTKILDKPKPKDLSENHISGWEEKPIFIATLCYSIAAELINREDPILASQRFLKILYVIKDNIKVNDKVLGLDEINTEGITLKDEYISLLKENLVKGILILMNQANEGTRRLSLQQFKINSNLPYENKLLDAKDWNPEKLKNSEVEDLYPLIFNSSSNSAETLEVIIVFSEILLKLKGLESSILNPAHGFSNVNNQFNRMWELWHKVHLNYLAWQNLDKIPHSDFFKKNFLRQGVRSKGNIKMVLIVDSIYCLSEIVRSHKVFGTSYVHNYTTLAKAHDKLGKWCSNLREWAGLDDSRHKRITQKLEKMIHQESTTFLHENYHYERAYEYYRSARNMHSGGKEYQQILKQMYLSEDDFDDESQHFSAAMERSKLNDRNSKVALQKLKNSEIHSFDNFVLWTDT